MEEAGKENSPNVKVPVRFAVCFQRGGKVRASFLPMAIVGYWIGTVLESRDKTLSWLVIC